MRRDLGRRQLAAVIIVLVVALVGFYLPRLIRMAIPEQKEVNVEVTQLSQLEEPEVKQEELVKPVEQIGSSSCFEEYHQVYCSCHQEG